MKRIINLFCDSISSFALFPLIIGIYILLASAFGWGEVWIPQKTDLIAGIFFILLGIVALLIWRKRHPNK